LNEIIYSILEKNRNLKIIRLNITIPAHWKLRELEELNWNSTPISTNSCWAAFAILILIDFLLLRVSRPNSCFLYFSFSITIASSSRAHQIRLNSASWPGIILRMVLDFHSFAGF